MLPEKLAGASIRWVATLLTGIALAMALFMVSTDDADARSLNQTERFLASGRGLWFENDWGRD